MGNDPHTKAQLARVKAVKSQLRPSVVSAVIVKRKDPQPASGLSGQVISRLVASTLVRLPEFDSNFILRVSAPGCN